MSTAVITGASEGIGLAVAEQLAARRLDLVLAARSADKLGEAARRCTERGAEVLSVATDVADEAQCRSLIEAAVERFGGIDIFVNNAGISMWRRLEDCRDFEAYRRLMDVNFFGAVYCTYFALPHLRKSKGVVATISSGQGKTGFPGFTGYSASKHAVQGFFDSLRIELEGSGVAVVVISPMAVDTGIHSRSLGGKANPNRPRRRSAAMPVEDCAAHIVRAIERRDRDVILTAQGKGMPWLKLIAPRQLDRMIARGVKRFYDRR